MQNSFYFKEEFIIYVNNIEYLVSVSGTKHLCEWDGNTWYVDLDEVLISDENDNTITENHPDYDEIMEEVNNINFSVEYEAEGFDYDDELSEMF